MFCGTASLALFLLYFSFSFFFVVAKIKVFVRIKCFFIKKACMTVMYKLSPGVVLVLFSLVNMKHLRRWVT